MHGNGRFDRPEDTLELRENPVAGQIDRSTTVGGDERQDDSLVFLQDADRFVLVGAHQSAVAGQIGKEDRRQSSRR